MSSSCQHTNFVKIFMWRARSVRGFRAGTPTPWTMTTTITITLLLLIGILSVSRARRRVRCAQLGLLISIVARMSINGIIAGIRGQCVNLDMRVNPPTRTIAAARWRYSRNHDINWRTTGPARHIEQPGAMRELPSTGQAAYLPLLFTPSSTMN